MILAERGLQFRLGIHHDWAAPGDRFAQGAAGDQQESHRLGSGADRNPVAVGEHENAAVPLSARLCRGKCGLAPDDIGDHRVARSGRVLEPGFGRYRDIEVLRVDGDVFDWSPDAVDLAADDLDLRPGGGRHAR